MKELFIFKTFLRKSNYGVISICAFTYDEGAFILSTMKKYFVWLLVLGVSPMLLTGCKLLGGKEETGEEAPVEIPAEALEPQFESVEYGFKVKGPDGWLKKADSLGMLVTYLKPGNAELFQENISLAREMKGDLSLKDYTASTVAQVGEFFPEHKLLEQSSVLLKGQKAEKIKYQITVEDLTLMAEQIIVDRPNEYLVITYMASPETFEASYEAFGAVKDSLVFVGGTVEE